MAQLSISLLMFLQFLCLCCHQFRGFLFSYKLKLKIQLLKLQHWLIELTLNHPQSFFLSLKLVWRPIRYFLRLYRQQLTLQQSELFIVLYEALFMLQKQALVFFVCDTSLCDQLSVCITFINGCTMRRLHLCMWLLQTTSYRFTLGYQSDMLYHWCRDCFKSISMLSMLNVCSLLRLSVFLFNLGDLVTNFLMCSFSQLVLGNIVGVRLMLCLQISDFQVSILVPFRLILLALDSFSQLTNSLNFQLCQSDKHSLMLSDALSHVPLHWSESLLISCLRLHLLIPRMPFSFTLAHDLLYRLLYEHSFLLMLLDLRHN